MPPVSVDNIAFEPAPDGFEAASHFLKLLARLSMHLVILSKIFTMHLVCFFRNLASTHPQLKRQARQHQYYRELTGCKGPFNFHGSCYHGWASRVQRVPVRTI